VCSMCGSNTATQSVPRSPSPASAETLSVAHGSTDHRHPPAISTAPAHTSVARRWPTPPSPYSANNIETPSDLRSRRISAQSSTISTCFLPGSTSARVTGKLVNFQLPHRGQYSVAVDNRHQRLRLQSHVPDVPPHSQPTPTVASPRRSEPFCPSQRHLQVSAIGGGVTITFVCPRAALLLSTGRAGTTRSSGDARRRTYRLHRGQFHTAITEVQLRNKVRASTVRSSTDGPPRTSTRQCCPGLIGCIPVMAPVAKTMPARTG
jgi:hypothetical protein